MVWISFRLGCQEPVCLLQTGLLTFLTLFQSQAGGKNNLRGSVKLQQADNLFYFFIYRAFLGGLITVEERQESGEWAKSHGSESNLQLLLRTQLWYAESTGYQNINSLIQEVQNFYIRDVCMESEGGLVLFLCVDDGSTGIKRLWVSLLFVRGC